MLSAHTNVRRGVAATAANTFEDAVCVCERARADARSSRKEWKHERDLLVVEFFSSFLYGVGPRSRDLQHTLTNTVYAGRRRSR